MPGYLSGPPVNPIARLLAGLAGVLVLVGAVFFGLFVIVAAIAFGLVAWAVIWLRLWWIGRRLRSSGAPAPNPFGQAERRNGGDDRSVIDADYEVVSRDEEKP